MDELRKLIVAQSLRNHAPVSQSRSNPTTKPEHSQIFRFFEEYFASNPDNNTSIPLEALDLTKRVQVGKVQTHGGFADVYDGWLEEEGPNQQPIKVAVKLFRTYEGDVSGHDKVW